jgi:hypothetical protein
MQYDLRYYGNATNSLLHNRNYYVTMEMQYNSLLHNRNCYVTMEMPSRPNISQYVDRSTEALFKRLLAQLPKNVVMSTDDGAPWISVYDL